MNLGGPEMLIVLAVLVLVFGANWLPKAARNLGRAKVEIDNTQRQLAETKQSMIEATGIDKADQAIKKANRALNTTPQKLVRDAAMKPPRPASAEATSPDVAAEAGSQAAAAATASTAAQAASEATETGRPNGRESTDQGSSGQVNTGDINASVTTSSIDEDPSTTS